MSVVRRREVLHIHTALAGPPCRRPPSQRRSHPSSPPPAAHSDPHRHRPLLHLTQREATSAVTSPLHRREDVSTARASSPTRAKTRRRPCIQMRWRAPLPLPPALAPGPSHASTRAAAVEPLLPRPEAQSSVLCSSVVHSSVRVVQYILLLEFMDFASSSVILIDIGT